MTPGISSRHRLLALLLWLPAAAGSAALFAAGAALAAWLNVTAGEEDGLQDALLIDLTEIAPVEALPPLPDQDPEPAPAPEPAAKTAEPPPPATAPLAEPPADEPPPAVANPAPPEAVKPAPTRAPPPLAAPVAKAQAREKPVPEAAPRPKAKATAKPAVQPAEAKPANPKSGSETTLSSRPKGSPAAVAKWKQKVQSQLASHIKRKRLAQIKGSLALAFTIDGSGQVTGVTLTRSSGNAELDAAVLAHARKKTKVAAPPNGQATTLTLPMRF